MSPLVFALVLFSASLHVTWNALVKTCSDKASFAWITTVMGVFVLVPCFVLNILLTSRRVPQEALGLAIISGLFEALYVIFLFRAYEFSDLSVVYPLSRGMAPVLTMFTAGTLVRDSVTFTGAGVVGLIIAGVVLVSLSSLKGEKQGRRIGFMGIVMAFCTGCMIAGYHIVDRRVMLMKPEPSPLQYLFFVQFFMAVFVTIWATLFLRRDLDSLKRECETNFRGVLIVGFATPLAYLLIILALSLGNVTYIVAGRNVGIFLSTVVGALFLGERVGGMRLAGGVLIAVGVILLVFL